jgi:hypothetical protein
MHGDGIQEIVTASIPDQLAAWQQYVENCSCPMSKKCKMTQTYLRSCHLSAGTSPIWKIFVAFSCPRNAKRHTTATPEPSGHDTGCQGRDTRKKPPLRSTGRLASVSVAACSLTSHAGHRTRAGLVPTPVRFPFAMLPDACIGN